MVALSSAESVEHILPQFEAALAAAVRTADLVAIALAVTVGVAESR